ncbi:MAG TPA: hypothetical protein VF618_03435 [Thermoanaerobaculia bacterium]
MGDETPVDLRALLAKRNRLAEFAALARRLEAERAGAASMLEHALRTTPVERWDSLVQRPELRTNGTIERLAELVNTELTRNPRHAEKLARFAVAIAEKIADDAYPRVTIAQIRGSAWKDYGKVLSYLARHGEALQSFDRAEAALDGLRADLAHDRSIIHLNRAITLSEMGQHQQALRYLADCGTTFKQHGDTKLYILSEFAEGVVLQRLGKYREARETYLLLLASSAELDRATRASLHQDIGMCSTELGDFDAAGANLAKAIALHHELGQPIELARAEYGRGRLLLRKRLYAQAVEHLRPVRHRFLMHSLAEEAGLCGLEMVEGLLLLARAEEAERLAQTILSEFLAANLNSRAITALGYLTEAIAARKATPKTAIRVREYVLSLRTSPEREFETHD